MSTEPNSQETPVRPDPEVRPKRRIPTSAFKIRLLDELDAAKPGQRGEIMRRESVYSSQITDWRRQRTNGSLDQGRKRGRKGSDPLVIENESLRLRNQELENQLAVSEELNEAQGKVSALLQKISRKSASPK